MEVYIVYPRWWAGAEIDGVEYVYLGGEDEGTKGEGTKGEYGRLESWLCVCRGEERNPLDNGCDEVGMVGKDMVRSSSHTLAITFTWV